MDLGKDEEVVVMVGDDGWVMIGRLGHVLHTRDSGVGLR